MSTTQHPTETKPTERHAVANLTLNHPKNYLCVPLAIASASETDTQIKEVITLQKRARRGARALSLSSNNRLTPLGSSLVHEVRDNTTVEAALSRLVSLSGSSERFIDSIAPYWEDVSQRVLQNYPPAGDFVTLLEKTGPVYLDELALIALKHDHQVSDYLLRDPAKLSSLPRREQKHKLQNDPRQYVGCSTYQLKALLYHTGILTSRGADTSALVPTDDYWELTDSVLSSGGVR
jgi:hypothetical protein